MKIEDALQRFLNEEECLIYTIPSSSVSSIIEGVITEIGEGWIRVKDKEDTESIVNIRNVIRVREYPRNKNGKKKLIIG